MIELPAWSLWAGWGADRSQLLQLLHMAIAIYLWPRYKLREGTILMIALITSEVWSSSLQNVWSSLFPNNEAGVELTRVVQVSAWSFSLHFLLLVLLILIFTQKSLPLHSGCASSCDFSAWGKLDCIICHTKTLFALFPRNNVFGRTFTHPISVSWGLDLTRRWHNLHISWTIYSSSPLCILFLKASVVANVLSEHLCLCVPCLLGDFLTFRKNVGNNVKSHTRY